MIKLLGYDFVVEYKKGSLNVVVDALLRSDEEEIEVNAVLVVVPTWIQDLHEYETNAQLVELKRKWELGELDISKYQCKGNLLLRKGRVVIGDTSEMKIKIL